MFYTRNMKNFYKEMIFAVVLVLAYFFVLPSFLGWYFAPKDTTIEKPQYASVVANDSRSVCEKQSEIRAYQEWKKKCVELKGQKDCFLSKEESDKILSQKEFVVSQCNHPASD